MKRFRQSSMPRIAKSGMGKGNWINYKRAGKEMNPNSVNTGKGRVNKTRVLQLRYLQSKKIKPVMEESILQWCNSAGKA